jgi:hypothetical protein
MLDAPTQVLASALERASSRTTRRSRAEWRFRLPGTHRIARAELSTRWLSLGVMLHATREPMDAQRVAAVMRRNARVEGLARIVGHAPRRELVIDLPTEDLPWHDEPRLDGIVAAALEDLRGGLDRRFEPLDASESDTLPRETLERLLEQAGWPAQSGGDETIEVALELPGHYAAAQLTTTHRVIRLSASLLAAEHAVAPGSCRAATRVLVWLAASGLRMVKPTASRRRVALEAALPTALAAPAALGHACGALSAALRQVIAEARLLLADEHLADTYLAMTGFSKAA